MGAVVCVIAPECPKLSHGKVREGCESLKGIHDCGDLTQFDQGIWVELFLTLAPHAKRYPLKGNTPITQALSVSCALLQSIHSQSIH